LKAVELTPRLEDCSFLAVHDYLFSAAMLWGQATHMSKYKLPKVDAFMSLLYRKLIAIIKPLSFVGGNSKCVLSASEADSRSAT
jgi:hypothetical protein